MEKKEQIIKRYFSRHQNVVTKIKEKRKKPRKKKFRARTNNSFSNENKKHLVSRNPLLVENDSKNIKKRFMARVSTLENRISFLETHCLLMTIQKKSKNHCVSNLCEPDLVFRNPLLATIDRCSPLLANYSSLTINRSQFRHGRRIVLCSQFLVSRFQERKR